MPTQLARSLRTKHKNLHAKKNSINRQLRIEKSFPIHQPLSVIHHYLPLHPYRQKAASQPADCSAKSLSQTDPYPPHYTPPKLSHISESALFFTVLILSPQACVGSQQWVQALQNMSHDSFRYALGNKYSENTYHPHPLAHHANLQPDPTLHQPHL